MESIEVKTIDNGIQSAIYDRKDTTLNNYLTTLFYYLLPRNELKESTLESFGYIGDRVINICFNPFLEKSNIQTSLVNVDLSKYDYRGSIQYPYIYRIDNLEFKDFTLSSYDLQTEYNSYPSNFESKLLLYPYRYFLLTDYVNAPIIIQPQFLNNNELTINVKTGLSNTSKYVLYCKNYKGDINGNLEGIVNNNPFLFPVTSNAYQSFIANTGISFDTNKQLALIENNQNYKQNSTNNFVNGIGNVLSMGVSAMNLPLNFMTGLNLANNGLGLASTIINQQHNTQNYKLKEYQIEKSALATIQDKINTPTSIKSMGNDAIFNIENAKNRIDLIEFTITNERLQRISEFLTRYGVATNNYDVPNIRTRKYYNFIKTSNCNIDSVRIPYNDLKEIENIFNSGITFWHIDNGATIKNYYVDNEVL